MEKKNEKPTFQAVDVIGLFEALRTTGRAKLSDHLITNNEK